MGARGSKRVTTAALTRELLEARLGEYRDDASLPRRQAALEQFLQRGFPSTRQEDWKYTDLARAVNVSQQAIAAAADETVDTTAIVQCVAARNRDQFLRDPSQLLGLG